ncbi:MAG: sigma-70 family RNA polymerase sigma factor [Ruminiclostridium sp.]|nr:sigma-70 family RNA polymerase sigma factor [Ruminiclostridium sp.]
MDIKEASGLIEENLHTIFAWSISKLYDKTEAEDLAQDIICAVLSSVHRLEKDEAFYGYMWRIAENTLRARLRKKRPESVCFDDGFCGVYWNTPEEDYIKSEEISILRRELSLLSQMYREVTVRYYIYGKSCSEISAELGISTEMVKHYLFKTRKILKEGIGMTREFGEKSYNPAVLKLDYWGSFSEPYHDLVKRRLPGNILLSAYDKPVTVTELSIELGVSAAYLEDEIEILERHELIKKIGDKYQTNIIIFTEEYEKRLLEKIRPVFEDCSERVNEQLDRLFPQLKAFDFYKNGFDDNKLKWVFANIAMYHAVRRFDDMGIKKFGSYPPLANGSFGFVYGYDNDYTNHHFNGVYSHCACEEKTAWVSVENYRIIEKCQHLKFRLWTEAMKVFHLAVLFEEADENNNELTRLIDEGFVKSDNGRLSPNFAVFSESVFNEIEKRLAPVIDETMSCMEKICGIAEKTLMDYVPKALRDKCGQLAQINHQLDVMALIIETMVSKGQLVVPAEKANVCMFGVDRRSN